MASMVNCVAKQRRLGDEQQSRLPQQHPLSSSSNPVTLQPLGGSILAGIATLIEKLLTLHVLCVL